MKFSILLKQRDRIPQSLVRCTTCGSQIYLRQLVLTINGSFYCEKCKRSYKITEDNIIIMKPKNTLPLPKFYSSKDYVKYLNMMDKYQDDLYYSNLNPIIRWIHFSSHKIIHKWRSKHKGIVLDLGCGTGDHFRFIKENETLITNAELHDK